MGQKGSKPEEGKRIKRYLSSLCTGQLEDPASFSNQVQKQAADNQHVNKKKNRITLTLDQALLKLSRKKLLVQQFPSQASISSQIENHLLSRIASFSVVLLQGPFSEHFLRAIPYPLRSLRTSRSRLADFSEGVVMGPGVLRRGGVECVVVSETSRGVEAMERALGVYRGVVDCLVFVVEQDLQAIDYHQVFIKYAKSFIFEVQKVMLINKCLANIVYASASAQLLRIDPHLLADFFVDQLAARDPFLDRPVLTDLLLTFLLANLELQVSTTVVATLLTAKKGARYDEQFLNCMQQYPEAQKIIFQLRARRNTGTQRTLQSSLPKFCQNTPNFGDKVVETGQDGMRKELNINAKRRRLGDISFGMKQEQEVSGDFV